jgi:rubrerythrin
MKRMLFVLAVLSIALCAIAGTVLPREVRFVLQSALTNEREAAARYDAFARKAEEEGYRGAAALFRAQAQAERTHGRRFAALLQENDIPLPPEQTFTPAVGTTGDNLRAAASAERTERDGSYREAIETCNLNRATDIAKVFEQTRDSEVEHANLCTAAAGDLDSMKNAKTFYVCGRCGYTTDVKLRFCPACRHTKGPEAVE